MTTGMEKSTFFDTKNRGGKKDRPDVLYGPLSLHLSIYRDEGIEIVQTIHPS